LKVGIVQIRAVITFCAQLRVPYIGFPPGRGAVGRNGKESLGSLISTEGVKGVTNSGYIAEG